MVDTDIRKEIYNRFDGIQNISYECISYLINDANSELLWKLLKYEDPDAWKNDIDHPNLTKIEKGELIYQGQTNQTDFRVFMDTGAELPWTHQATILRIYPLDITPSNHIVGNVCVGFEVYSHYEINHLSNYQTRIDTIIQLLLSAFNGQEIGLLGRLYFDKGKSKVTSFGQIPYRGKFIIMCNWIAN
jgi:hypothetical protein